MTKNISRKNFLQKTGSALAVASIGFPSIYIPKSKSSDRNKIGVALVGLGSYSTNQLAPGLQRTDHCELRGIVTGSPHKIPVWQEEHGIPDANVYNYENMHEIADNDDIDVVYIVLPTGLHAKYSIVGAEAGKNVWCEKPFAMDVAECQAVIDACESNRVQLTIGYRMQHEPNTQEIIRYGKEQTYGEITGVRTSAGYSGGGHPIGDWRRNPDLGGGALYDMGVYPLNAARYATGMEPIAARGIQSSQRPDIYKFVDETTEFELEFPGGVFAKGETSFGKSVNYLEVEATGGWYKLQPFQSYTRVRGETSDGRELPADPGHQQARQMDNDALALKENKDPIVPGEDGLADVRLVEAIMESSERGGEWIQL